jgi:hypothetical protein
MFFRKAVNINRTGVPIEIAYIVYHYIRRKAADYIEYKEKWMGITSTVSCSTFLPVVTNQYYCFRHSIYQWFLI